MKIRFDTVRVAAGLLERAKAKPGIRTAVVHPCSADALGGAIEAAGLGLIEPILVGPEAKIRETAEAAHLSVAGFRIVDAPHSHAAAALSMELARTGEAQALMKGSLHTDELMGEVVKKENGLRTERRISHIFAMADDSYHKPFIITDAAINIAPDLMTKRDILQNAVDFLIGIADKPMTPKVAVLSAVETVNPSMVSTVDAACLSKMADRGQIQRALVDGPLAFDNAMSRDAARTKGIVSVVAGDADVLLMPDLESGNMLAKQLILLGGAVSAGLVLGARLPIILTSRSDGTASRIGSAALAVLMADAQANGRLGFTREG
ncbi:bifunctional enoyl-CoA hydratase/phosphate acetyltransferase [Gellertiella hungarica]|uniref:Phosphotransacetylase n=1 Tax=Gellertiella hungarica TaxID=1572859 RepID=A0A7W6NKA0_9HYPH|nr:bifunctional enoyl-CoA hydratase/phosphate acetyltransferase [Gellertiella hungarica]MBB4064087.1 phosphotransacetylase [Gellertiella hungarica]